MSTPEKKSFVLTGYCQRSTCNCGGISHNTFWQDGGFGGSDSLASLHYGIEKYLDELSGAGKGEHGKSFDIKVTITIEPLRAHDHKARNQSSFTGGEWEEHLEDEKRIMTPSEPADEVNVLDGAEQYGQDIAKMESDLREKIRTDQMSLRDYDESFPKGINENFLENK